MDSELINSLFYLNFFMLFLSSKNNFCEGSVLASPLNSRKSDPVTSKSQKKSKNKQTNTGDIQK